MNERLEFSMKTKKAAWERANGVCECGCKRTFGKHPKERPNYDHRIPAKLGGDASLENCAVIRVDCHDAKTTTEDIPRIVKVRREDNRMRGMKAKTPQIAGSKLSGWKRKIDGTVVKRTTK